MWPWFCLRFVGWGFCLFVCFGWGFGLVLFGFVWGIFFTTNIMVKETDFGSGLVIVSCFCESKPEAVTSQGLSEDTAEILLCCIAGSPRISSQTLGGNPGCQRY